MIEYLPIILAFGGGFLLGQAFLVTRANSQLSQMMDSIKEELEKAEEVHQDLKKELDHTLMILDDVDPAAAKRLRKQIQINRANMRLIENADQSAN